MYSVPFIPVDLTRHIRQIFELYPLPGYYCGGKKEEKENIHIYLGTHQEW